MKYMFLLLMVSKMKKMAPKQLRTSPQLNASALATIHPIRLSFWMLIAI